MNQGCYWRYSLTALLAVGMLAGCSQQGGEQSEGGQSAYGGVHVFEGQISDSSCGATHKMPDAKACTEGCVNGGDSYVLVVNGVVHPLEGNADEIKPFAGQTVQVSASMDGNTLHVVRISAPGAASQPTEG